MPVPAPRVIAARIVNQVMRHKRSLTVCAKDELNQLQSSQRALAQELSYGTVRWLPELACIAEQLLDKPLKRSQAEVSALLYVGLYQLKHLTMPKHVAVSETVAACREMKKTWATGLINAVLRKYLREQQQLDVALSARAEYRYAHPQWLIDELRVAWPESWEALLEANNQRPPMTLRVNAKRSTRAAYMERLQLNNMPARPAPHTTHGLILEQATDVKQLPGFDQGLVSVQDAGAQLVEAALDVKPGHRLLDACAAPGGKIALLLETTPDPITAVALDIDAKRSALIAANLERLGLRASVMTADARAPSDWWDGLTFDRILLDVPCSATGVIRRHPDIKLLRRADDLAQFQQAQRELLNAMWPLLAAGGKLAYVTCSVLPGENQDQIDSFLARTPDAHPLPLDWGLGSARGCGRQILTGEQGMDGFYYAALAKD